MRFVLQDSFDYILLYCIVLMGWSLLPNALRPFWDLLCFVNLGITRTWICRLNFAQRPIFSGLRFFNKPEISDPQLKVPPGGLVLPKKTIDFSRVSTRNPWISRRAWYPETIEVDKHAGLVKSHPFCTMLDLQLSFYCSLYYNSGAHSLLLQCLHII